MKAITLLTTSEKKRKGFEKVLSKYNIGVEISDIWIPEIQADNNADIAKFSAQFGANLLNRPVVKVDTGFYIEELSGFPGPLVKYVDEKIGAELFFEIIKKLKNRSASINCALAYCEPKKEPIMFEGGCKGTILNKLPQNNDGFIDRLFIPSHPANKNKLTIGDIRRKDYNQFLEIWGNVEEEFAKWYTSRSIKNIING